MNKLKGTILELIVENLLIACGFKKVIPDGIYVHKTGNGLRYVNGKGSNHDADVLMEPPQQMPFAYPARLLVECKAYSKSKIGLGIVRAALGLQHDLNDFEIVTTEHLKQRKNYRRITYAIEHRERYKYQIAVASINGFKKTAIEFACNHKIPLIDLSLLIDNIETDINSFENIPEERQIELLNLSRQHFPNFETTHIANNASHILGDNIRPLLDIPECLMNIAIKTKQAMKDLLVGTLPNGDTLLLTADELSKSLLFMLQNEAGNHQPLMFTVHFDERGVRKWYASVIYAEQPIRINFELPDQLFMHWRSTDFDLNEAVNVKERYLKYLNITGKYRESRINIHLRIPDDWFNAIRETID